MNLETIRSWQFTKMELSLKTTGFIFAQADAQALKVYRDGGTGWTALEVLGHLRDFEMVFYQRALVTVEEDHPPLPFPDPDELALSRNYNGQDWQALLNELRTERMVYIDFLKARAETDWERTAQHPKRGPLTLHDQLFLTTLHDTIHLEQITRILLEKKSGA